ncbi:MAG: ABC transporter permease [Acidobacteriota bacterium]
MFSHDLRHGLRLLLRTPLFTMSTVLVLALGIGATTAVFGVVHGLLLSPLPYADGERLVLVWEHNIPRNRPRNVISAANYLAWRARSTSFDETALFAPTRQNLTGAGEPVELDGVAMEVPLLHMVGARPLVGRVFAAGEDQPEAPRTVVISEGLWQRTFGGRADIVGQTIRLNDEPTTVIGVLPSDFELFGLRGDVWLPLVLQPAHREFRGRGFLSVARLKPGVTRDQAQQELAAVFAQLVDEQPDFNAGWTINVVPLREQLTGDVRPALLTLFAAVVAVLLIACVNLVNLLLARASTRRHEMALRSALGAGTGRLAGQLLTETAILVALGGLAGLALARVLQGAMLDAAADTPVPLLGQVSMNGAVVAFAVAATALTALLCGLGPALAARRAALTESLHDGGRGAVGHGGGRLRAALVASEVALAVVLLGGAGLLVRSYVALERVPPGFQPGNVLTLRVTLSTQSPDDRDRVVRFHEEAVERLRGLPGVTAAAGTVFLPLAGIGSATSFWLLDRPEPAPADRPVADIRPITDGYFQTLGIPLLAGRDVAPSDTADSPFVAVVNETFVRRFFPGESPLGKRLTYSWDTPTPVEIVGVVGDVKLTSLDGEVRATVYLPNRQRAMPMMTYVLRTAGDPAAVAPSAVGAIRQLAPDQPVTSIRPLDDVVRRSVSRPRLTSGAVAAFAGVALLLAVLGVYGVMAYGVSQRLREFGVRLALGAEPRSVQALVLRQGMTMVAVGLVAGLALAVPASRLLRSMLFGVEPFDPATFGAVAAIMTTVGFAACYVPAWRGTQVDPAITLRAE